MKGLRHAYRGSAKEARRGQESHGQERGYIELYIVMELYTGM
jgi:hypothetical protein